MRQVLFKNYNRDARHFTMLHPRLAQIINFMSEVAWALWKDHLLVTSIYRDDKSTHNQKPPFLRIDIALLEKGGNSGSELMRKIVNIVFPYGKMQSGKLGETIVPLDHGSGPHMHIQISPRWQKK